MNYKKLKDRNKILEEGAAFLSIDVEQMSLVIKKLKTEIKQFETEKKNLKS